VNTWKIILATMLIFGTGVVTGALVVRNSDRGQGPLRPRNINQARPVGTFSPGGLRLEFLRRAQRDLDLNPEQRERIDKLLKESQERTRKIMEPVAPDLRAELNRTKEEFQQVLTPEQRMRFEELMKKQQRPHEPHHTGGPRAPRVVETNY
jgi:Spy/CpxP family protein refolding chaperone